MGKGRGRPATLPENREKQLISLAFDEIENRLREGSVSNTLLAQLFRMGTRRERVEQEQIEATSELKRAQVKRVESAEKFEQLYKEAMDMFRIYSGDVDDE